MRLDEARRIVEAAFADLHPNTAGKWIELGRAELEANPEMAREILNLVNTAYAPIGGHVKFGSAADITRNASYWIAADVDDDPDPDAVSLGKRTRYGVKSVGMGHDGSTPAKRFVLQRKATDMGKRGNYGEMSGAIAHIMLTRHGAPTVNDQETVERILGKPVEWIGLHPDGKYPNNPGWYRRVIAGKPHTKIMVGLPL